MRGRRLRAACGRGGSSGTRCGVAAAAVAASGAARAASGARGARPGPPGERRRGSGRGARRDGARGGGGGEGGGAVAASLWQESFGAARRGRPAACVPAGGRRRRRPAPRAGPRLPRATSAGGVFSHISLPVTGLPAPGSAIFGPRASREPQRGRGAERGWIGRRDFLRSFPPRVRSRRSGRAMLSRCRRGGLRERRGGGRGSCSGGTPRRIKVWESSGR